MDKPKQRVNVTRFLADFRSGCSDEELIRQHGLRPEALKKLLRVLEEKQLLNSSELKDRSRAGCRTEDSRPLSGEPISPARVTSASACPQCGAEVTGKSLTCPECGHVLPGEERWSNLEPKKGLLERVPPIVWGCIIALPIGLVLLYTLKGILVSMRSMPPQKLHKAASRQVPTKKPPTGAEPAQTGVGATQDATGTKTVTPTSIEAVVALLTKERVISAADKAYTRFTAGDRWPELPREEKIARLHAMALVLEQSGIEAGFTVTTATEELVARVDTQRIDLIDKDGFTDSVERPVEEGEPR